MASPTQDQRANAQYTIQYSISGQIDPTISGFDAVAGTMYIKLSAPVALYQKQDDGNTTNWLEIETSGGGGDVGTIGTQADPVLLNAAGDTVTATAANQRIIFIDTTTPGGVTLTTDPFIIDPFGYIGKEWTIIGESEVEDQAVTLQPGAHLQINGNWVSTGSPTNASLTIIQVTATVDGVASYRTLGNSD